MTTSHTPSPYHFLVIGPSSNPKNGTGWRDILSTGAEFQPSYVGEALEADAQHIVHCVNSHDYLVAALVEIRDYAIDGKGADRVDLVTLLAAVRRVAKTALAKAKGEQA